MLIIAFFTQTGTPKTGLSPIVDIIDASDGSLTVNDGAMTELVGGFYKYDFTAYDEDKDYCIVADGTSTLSGNDRYVYSTNETGGVGNILKINKNRLKIENNQLKIYDDDETTVLYKSDLKDNIGNATSTNVFERNPT